MKKLSTQTFGQPTIDSQCERMTDGQSVLGVLCNALVDAGILHANRADAQLFACGNVLASSVCARDQS